MVRIRLRRIGAPRHLQWRLVVTDKRTPRDGRFIETIGFYDANIDPPKVEIKEDRLKLWVAKGAQMTDQVAALVKAKGIKL